MRSIISNVYYNKILSGTSYRRLRLCNKFVYSIYYTIIRLSRLRANRVYDANNPLSGVGISYSVPRCRIIVRMRSSPIIIPPDHGNTVQVPWEPFVVRVCAGTLLLLSLSYTTFLLWFKTLLGGMCVWCVGGDEKKITLSRQESKPPPPRIIYGQKPIFTIPFNAFHRWSGAGAFVRITYVQYIYK